MMMLLCVCVYVWRTLEPVLCVVMMRPMMMDFSMWTFVCGGSGNGECVLCCCGAAVHVCGIICCALIYEANNRTGCAAKDRANEMLITVGLERQTNKCFELILGQSLPLWPFCVVECSVLREEDNTKKTLIGERFANS